MSVGSKLNLFKVGHIRFKWLNDPKCGCVLGATWSKNGYLYAVLAWSSLLFCRLQPFFRPVSFFGLLLLGFPINLIGYLVGLFSLELHGVI